MKGTATIADETAAPTEPAPPLEGAVAPEPPPEPPPRRERDKERDRERPSTVMRAITNEEDRGLKDWLDVIGTAGAFKVQVNRTKPQSITVNGRTIDTAGYLDTYDDTFDDDFLKREWGGGTYALRVTRKGSDGSYKYERGLHRTVVIAGEPRVDRLPGNAPTQTATGAPAQPESTKLAQAAFDVMEKQLERANKEQQPRGIDPAMQLLLEQFRRDADANRSMIATLQAKIDTLSNQKPPEDTVKDKILGSLIEGESGRINALRAQHDSELRSLRDNHIAEIRTLNERFDRERDNAQRQFDRTLDSIKGGYEREIASMRISGDVTVNSNKSAFDTQVHVLNADIKRLERENELLRSDLRELREKKDQSLAEKLKEINTLKEALGGDDDGKETSTVEKIAEAVMNPAALEQIGKFFAPKTAAPAPQVVQAQVQAAPARPRIMRDRRTGEKFAQIANPAVPGGIQLVPVKKIPQTVQKEDGSKVEVPEVEPSQVALLVQYLEKAFTGGQDPVVVAQSGRSMVPESIVTWIRDNDQGATSGVDLFMSKVAKLPGSSPLQTQRGRNWIRKVGKALTGDDPAPEAAPEPETPPPAAPAT